MLVVAQIGQRCKRCTYVVGNILPCIQIRCEHHSDAVCVLLFEQCVY